MTCPWVQAPAATAEKETLGQPAALSAFPTDLPDPGAPLTHAFGKATAGPTPPRAGVRDSAEGKEEAPPRRCELNSEPPCLHSRSLVCLFAGGTRFIFFRCISGAEHHPYPACLVRRRGRRRRWAGGCPACSGILTWRTEPAARSARRSPRPRRGTAPPAWTPWPVSAGLARSRGTPGGGGGLCGFGLRGPDAGPRRGRRRGRAAARARGRDEATAAPGVGPVTLSTPPGARGMPGAAAERLTGTGAITAGSSGRETGGRRWPGGAGWWGRSVEVFDGDRT